MSAADRLLIIPTARAVTSRPLEEPTVGLTQLPFRLEVGLEKHVCLGALSLGDRGDWTNTSNQDPQQQRDVS